MNFQELLLITITLTFLVSLGNVLKLLLVHFPYPICATAGHMLVTYIFCAAYMKSSYGSSFRVLDVRSEIRCILPISILYAACTGLSNLSLLTLYPSFRALLGTMMPMFTMIISSVAQTEKFNAWSYIAILPIAAGTLIQITHESAFNWTGVLYICLANILRAMKVVAQAKLLIGERKFHPVELMYYVSRSSCVIFSLWSLISEPGAFIALYDSAAALDVGFFWYVIGALVSAAYTILAAVAVKQFNATLWTFIQLFRTPLISIISFFLFGNVVNMYQATGFVLSSIGVYIYDSRGRVREKAMEKKA